MPNPILHHFDISPFAEKIRVIFGLKSLSWRSVQIPIIMPKPDLTRLTGGYRKTPVLQIGADVYCDTSLITREIERRWPNPTLFPNRGQGLFYAQAHWSNASFFNPGAALSMAENDEIPEAVLADRRAFFNFMDFDRLAEEKPHCYADLRANAQLIEDELAAGADYLSGPEPGLADINAWFVVWMCRNNFAGSLKVFQRLPNLRRWEERMLRIGEGERIEIDAKAALDEAGATEPAAARGVDADEFLPIQQDQEVVVTPTDYGKVPVRGRVHTMTVREIAIRRRVPELGDIVVHFPRIGYRIEAV